MVQTHMAKRVFVPTDGSEGAWHALDHAAAEHPDARLTLLFVINLVGAGAGGQAGDIGYAEEWYETAEQRAEALFDDAADRLDGSFDSEITVGRPAHAIVAFAEEHPIDAIVMGSRGREGVTRILLGSVAETTVRRSPVPVTVVR